MSVGQRGAAAQGGKLNYTDRIGQALVHEIPSERRRVFDEDYFSELMEMTGIVAKCDEVSPFSRDFHMYNLIVQS